MDQKPRLPESWNFSFHFPLKNIAVTSVSNVDSDKTSNNFFNRSVRFLADPTIDDPRRIHGFGEINFCHFSSAEVQHWVFPWSMQRILHGDRIWNSKIASALDGISITSRKAFFDWIDTFLSRFWNDQLITGLVKDNFIFWFEFIRYMQKLEKLKIKRLQFQDPSIFSFNSPAKGLFKSIFPLG